MKANYLFYFDTSRGYVTLSGANVICVSDLATCIEAIVAMERDGHRMETDLMVKAAFILKVRELYPTHKEAIAAQSKTIDFSKAFSRGVN